MNNENSYQTSDLCLVTTLSLFLPILRIDKTNAKRAVFSFANIPLVSTTLESYWNDSLRVNPKQFFNQLKLIKSRIYAGE